MSSVSVHNINIYDNPFIILNMLYCDIPVFINMSILCTLTEINIHSFIPHLYSNLLTKNDYIYSTYMLFF